jgi:hypothetical protein
MSATLLDVINIRPLTVNKTLAFLEAEVRKVLDDAEHRMGRTFAEYNDLEKFLCP